MREFAPRTPSRSIPSPQRERLESAFKQPLGDVRLHSATQDSASLAYTVGSDIALTPGEANPDTRRGELLLAHEVAHTLQQRNASTTSPVREGTRGDVFEQEATRAAGVAVAGGDVGALTPTSAVMVQHAEDDTWIGTASQFWRGVKQRAYTAMIDGMRGAQRSALAAMREKARELDAPWKQAIAVQVISEFENVSDFLISLILAVVGLVVGFVAGIARALWGLLDFVVQLFSMLILFVAGIFDESLREQFDRRANAMIEGFKNLMPALRRLKDEWVKEFEAAGTDRQTLMIGELVGEIESILATILAGGKAASAVGDLTMTMRPLEQLAIFGAGTAGGAITMTVPIGAIGAGGSLSGAMAMSVTERGREAGERSKVDKYEKELERKKLEARQTAEGRAAREKLAKDIKEKLPGDRNKVKVEVKQIERTEAGRAQTSAVTPEGAPVAMEDEFVITLEDGTKFNADGFKPLPGGKNYQFLEHKEALTIWENSHYARAEAIPEIDAMLNRHAEIYMKLRNSGCAGFVYSSNTPELAKLLTERIAALKQTWRAGGAGLVPPF